MEDIRRHLCSIESKLDASAKRIDGLVETVMDLEGRVSKFEGGLVVGAVLYALIMALMGGALTLLVQHLIGHR